MVLHANHQYRIGPQGSAYSTVTSTTAASTLRTASIRQERSCTKLAKPKHKPEPPTAQCHFRYGRAAKQVYEKGGEEMKTQYHPLLAAYLEAPGDEPPAKIDMTSAVADA